MELFLTVAGHGLALLGALYALAALLCRARVRPAPPGQAHAAVTVLKPLCGAEPRLAQNLASLCEQDYPAGCQLLFGVRDARDPAVAVVRRLMTRFPGHDIELVIDARRHGRNLKVSNLINMAGAIRHPWLVIADSDIGVPPGYLDKVTAPLADPAVGIVTCLYRARALGGFWSRLGAQFIDSWFTPSVRVASAFGGSCFGFGATIALRATSLAAIGGFAALRDRLADDFLLGQLTRNAGLATVLSEVCVTTDVTERSFRALWSRERRWLHTIRTINPLGYAFSWITFTFPVLALALALAPTRANLACAGVAAAARLAPHWRARPPGWRAAGDAALAPLRDCLLLAAWLGGLFGATVRWRGQTLRLDQPIKG